MNLVIYPEKGLREKSLKVASVTSEIRSRLTEMHSLMIKSGGVGLAAPQVGLMLRMFVVDLYDGNGPSYFINPSVRDLKAGFNSMREGCLSIPNAWGEVSRPSYVSVQYSDINGINHEIVCGGILSRVIQHENDHLNGILHIDRMASYELRSTLESIWEHKHQ